MAALVVVEGGEEPAAVKDLVLAAIERRPPDLAGRDSPKKSPIMMDGRPRER